MKVIIKELVLVKVTGWPIIDSLVSIGIAGFMFRSVGGIVTEGLGIVMDRSLEAAVVRELQVAVTACPGIESWPDFKTRHGRVPHVDFHAVVRPEMTVTEFHALFLDVQRAVRGITGPATKVLMHADPGASAS